MMIGAARHLAASSAVRDDDGRGDRRDDRRDGFWRDRGDRRDTPKKARLDMCSR